MPRSGCAGVVNVWSGQPNRFPCGRAVTVLHRGDGWVTLSVTGPGDRNVTSTVHVGDRVPGLSGMVVSHVADNAGTGHTATDRPGPSTPGMVAATLTGSHG